jgi:hypothetical protein
VVVLQHLRRVRWAVRATLFLGVAASVVANVLHALDNPISQAIAAWPPLALLLTVELISRVPVHRRWLAAARLIATATIAGIAAWVSYWHMAGVAARYGETGASPYLLPLSVDGLIVVASICLVELGGRITTLENADAEPPAAAEPLAGVAGPAQAAHPAPAAHPAQAAHPAAANHPAPVADRPGPVPGLIPTPAVVGPAAVAARAGRVPGRAGRAARGGNSPMDHRTRAEIAAALSQNTGESAAFTPSMTRQPRQPVVAGAGRAVPAQRSRPASRATTSQTVPPKKERRSATQTVALANQIKAARPELTETQVAAELGISPSRWRTVRREAGSLAA